MESKQIILRATRAELQLIDSETHYPLTDNMNAAIDEAKAQIKNGDSLSHLDANKEISEWLEK